MCDFNWEEMQKIQLMKSAKKKLDEMSKEEIEEKIKKLQELKRKK